MDSQAQRASALALRRAMSCAQRKEAERRIIARLLPRLQDAACIGMYMAQGSEVSLDALLALLPQKTLAAPVCAAGGIMCFHEIMGPDRFALSAMKIREPQGGRLIRPQALDVILVPLVAFDAQCRRLGHGAGYYDRYLVQTDALRIGVGFACQKVDTIHALPHDIAMDLIVTEEEILSQA